MSDVLSEKIYKSIVEDIVTGAINGDDVIRERELIERFEVSKSPVRDALIKLCSDDILYSIPRFGYKIRMRGRDYFEGIQRLRLAIEPHYLDLYFERLTPAVIEMVREASPKFERDKFKNPIDYWNLTSEFHLKLAEVYRDQYYYDTLKTTLDRELISFSELYWHSWGKVIDSKLEDNHTVILDYIAAGEKAQAIETLKKDILSF